MLTLFIILFVGGILFSSLAIMIAPTIIVLWSIFSEEKDINRRRRRILNEYNVVENWKKAHKAEKTNKWGDPVEEVKTGWDLFKN